MKRGFKAEAERIATSLRTELNLAFDDRLDPMDLADHLAIPVLGLSALTRKAPVNGFRDYFSRIDPDSFSAITIFHGYRRFIVHNDAHHPNRQTSNLSHELSHTILEHEPAPVANAEGQRFWNAEVEQEAIWLGAALLVPREAALAMIRSGRLPVEIAAHFGVSEELCSWRIHQTGILLQVERAKQWSRVSSS